MENLALYTVKVSTAGHVVFYKNRKVRTPVVFKNVYEHELSLLESQLNRLSLEYTVDKDTGEEPAPKSITKAEPVNDDVKIEELYPHQDQKEPESLIDKLISENS